MRFHRKLDVGNQAQIRPGCSLTALMLALVACLSGCVDTSQQRVVSREGNPTTLEPLDPLAPRSMAPEQLVYTGSSGIQPLPKYETEWEKRIKRLARDGRSTGNPLADEYDDYRTTHADKFYLTQPPATSGIRAPAEHEPSQAVMLKWLYPTDENKLISKLFGDMVQAAWGVVPILMLVDSADPTHRALIEDQLIDRGFTTADLADTSKIIWYEQESGNVWADNIWPRDFGPFGILDAEDNLSFVDFRYFHARAKDDRTPTDLAETWGINVFRPDLDFEGGNFMTTGNGLCAATKTVLFANANLAVSAIEDIFEDYLGCQSFLFPEPLLDAAVPVFHIDLFAKFGPDNGVLVGQFTAAQHPVNHAILEANAALFSAAKTPGGEPLTVTRIPMPDLAGPADQKVLLTYTNALALSNGSQKVVLIPTYPHFTTHEAAALQAFAEVFPGWTQVKIDSEAVIPGGGAVHCLTMQIPAGNRTKMEADPAALCDPDKWKCAPPECGPITAKGCCIASNELTRCDDGVLIKVGCNQANCGWNIAQERYACGSTGEPDPSGTYPMSCDALYGDIGVGPGDGAVSDLGAPVDQGALPPDGALAADGGELDQDDDSGCSCRVGAAGPDAPSWLLVVLILLVLWAGRRRR